MSSADIPLTPELTKLANHRSETGAIQEFLEWMQWEKGYTLQKEIPAGWSKDGRRLSDKELIEEFPDIVKLKERQLQLAGFQHAILMRVVLERDNYADFAKELGAGNTQAAQDIVNERGWQWDRGFMLDDIGSEGGKLDKVLYEFIGVDPNKVEEERRALLDHVGKASQ